MNDFGLSNALHTHHPMLNEYTFFSPVHHSYSHLDFFLTSNSITKDISDTQIQQITISYSAPVTMTVTQNRSKPAIKQWKFNTSLLTDP